VSDNCRGKGLGKLINALALVESHKRFGWKLEHRTFNLRNSLRL